MDTIININNWDIKSGTTPDAPTTGGAALWQNSRYYNVDAQWDLTKYTKSFNLLVGGNARLYNIIPDGNNFVDFSRPIAERNKELPNGTFGSLVSYKNIGGFFQVTKTLFDEKLKLWGSTITLIINPFGHPALQPFIPLRKNIISGLLFRKDIVSRPCLKPCLLLIMDALDG
jgi:hypothetical protein